MQYIVNNNDCNWNKKYQNHCLCKKLGDYFQVKHIVTLFIYE